MIIENAFLKLPELLTSDYDHRDTFEPTVVHLLAAAVLMELNSRNIASPFGLVRTEKPYPAKDRDDKPIRADLFVSLERVIPTARLMLYGAREQNWIEAKAFLSSLRGGATPPKTANAGKILRDILRLCLLPEELAGSNRQNGRYLLIVSSAPPSESLALQKRNSQRFWLSRLLTEGYNDLHIDLRSEPKTLREAIGSGFTQSPDLQLKLRFRTMMFQPEARTPSPVFWGYLSRILDFQISASSAEVKYEDKPGARWDESRVKQLGAVRDVVLMRF